jgi:maleylpyruvate isomerase
VPEDEVQQDGDEVQQDGIVDLEADPEGAARLCRTAQARLFAALQGIDDAEARRPSRLPGWSVGHVITHLARNADGHARRLDGALHDQDLARYPGGPAQRARDIAKGSGRPARELLTDLARSQERLEALFAECSAAGWPGDQLLGGDGYPVTACPAHRLREVEMHHVDLGIGYEPADWPPEYVAWDLPELLTTVPERLHSRPDRAALLAWVAGRAPVLAGVVLDPL